jgi:hypothetical protein
MQNELSKHRCSITESNRLSQTVRDPQFWNLLHYGLFLESGVEEIRVEAFEILMS